MAGLPGEFGSRKTVWRLFDQWNADGTLDVAEDRLNSEPASQELWCVDGTVVRAHRCAAGGGQVAGSRRAGGPRDHALGRSRGGFTTSVPWLCDGDARPLHFHLAPGQTHDSAVFDTLTVGADAELVDRDGTAVPWPDALVGDKG